MRFHGAAAIAGVVLFAGLAPAQAQNLNDVGRQLQNQFLPQQQQPQGQDRERSAYEQGRRDQDEAARRERDARRGGGYDDRRRGDRDSRDRDEQAQRFRSDRERALMDEQRARGRY